MIHNTFQGEDKPGEISIGFLNKHNTYRNEWSLFCMAGNYSVFINANRHFSDPEWKGNECGSPFIKSLSSLI